MLFCKIEHPNSNSIPHAYTIHQPCLDENKILMHEWMRLMSECMDTWMYNRMQKVTW